MRSRTTGLALLSLLPPLATIGVAQTPKYVTAPPGYLSTTGGDVSNALGGGGRVMFGEGTLRGSALTITRVDYRTQSFQDYDVTNGMGRSFSRVTLTMSHTNVDLMNAFSFSGNVWGTATKVFDAKVVWPTLKGKLPQAWGFPVSFPFSTPWKYNGRDDMLFDYDFQGGTLVNGSSTRAPYWMDAAFTTTRTWRDVVPTWLPYWPAGGRWKCGDSAFPTTPVAFARLSLKLYAKKHWDSNKAGMVEFNGWSRYTAPNAPVIGAITTGGNHNGVNVGARCYNLHLDLNKLVTYVTGTASALTGTSGNLLPTQPIPYKGRFAGVPLYLQVAWADSMTKEMSLSTASWITLPPKEVQLRKMMLYRYSPTQLWMSGASPGQTLPRLTLK